MKRTGPIKRKTPMPGASKPMARSSKRLRSVRRKKTEHARPVVDDGFGEPYLAFVRTQPCCMRHLGGCSGDVVPHHHRKGVHCRDHSKTVPLCAIAHHAVGWHQHGRVRPMTRAQTVVIIEAEIERLNEEWRRR